MIFLAAIYNKGLIFFVKIRLIDAHLFYEYFVRQYVRQATKSINVFIQTRHFLEWNNNSHDTFCEDLSDE